MSETTNGKRQWAEWAVLVAGMAAFWVPMQQRLQALEDANAAATISAKAGLESVSTSAKEERDRLEARQREFTGTAEARMKDALGAHLAFSDRKSAEIDAALTDLRERTRGLEAKMAGMNTQIEVQHKWIRDAIRTLVMMLRASWDGERIVWPDWTILEGIGEAPLNGNGHSK